MPPISITSDQNNIVIHIEKSSLEPAKLEKMIQYFYEQILDNADIPFVDDDEQREIEVLLENPECHIYDDAT